MGGSAFFFGNRVDSGILLDIGILVKGNRVEILAGDIGGY
jgi:hypothetical protein